MAGYKSYFVAVAVAAIEFAYQLNYIDVNAKSAALSFLASLGLATMAAKVNRVEEELKH